MFGLGAHFFTFKFYSSGTRAGPTQGQPEGRGHRTGPSTGMHRVSTGSNPPLRDEEDGRALRGGVHVHRNGDGRRGGVRGVLRLNSIIHIV